MKTHILTQPDDWHLHLRDGDLLATTVPAAAQRFARAIIMPNLTPPVTTIDAATDYHARILAVLPNNLGFQPLMTLYMTDATTPEQVQQAKQSKLVFAFKLYPAGATTHSAAGVTKLKNSYPALEAMQKQDVPLLIHGEVTDPHIDIFDREKIFIEQHLAPLILQFPNLRIVLEHVSTKEGVDFVAAGPTTLAATITTHHLLLNRNDMLASSIKPHLYCLPIVKQHDHQQALIHAATSGSTKFFLGTDSAPHPRSHKECHSGCAGIYTSHAAIELYAEVFEQAGALDKLEAFASFNGADFYQLPRNKTQIKLIKKPWSVPKAIPFGEEELIPFRAGENVSWQLETNENGFE